MKDYCETSGLCNAMVDTSMFPLKVAGHIQLSCGPGSLHPELLLELLLSCVTFTTHPDRHIQ
eukprot:10248821-Prorocentrum_lima.AAC.1